MEKSELKKAARIWKRNEVESPCVSICLVHPTENTHTLVAGDTVKTISAYAVGGNTVTAGTTILGALKQTEDGGTGTEVYAVDDVFTIPDNTPIVGSGFGDLRGNPPENRWHYNDVWKYAAKTLTAGMDLIGTSDDDSDGNSPPNANWEVGDIYYKSEILTAGGQLDVDFIAGSQATLHDSIVGTTDNDARGDSPPNALWDIGDRFVTETWHIMEYDQFLGQTFTNRDDTESIITWDIDAVNYPTRTFTNGTATITNVSTLTASGSLNISTLSDPNSRFISDEIKALVNGESEYASYIGAKTQNNYKSLLVRIKQLIGSKGIKKVSLSDDFRSTALLQKSVEIMNRFKVWDDLIPYASPLNIMRIIDMGEDTVQNTTHDFKSSDVSELPFGWNISNSKIKNVLTKRIERISTAEICYNSRVKEIFTRTNEARIVLDNDERITTKFIIGADGKESFVRNFFKIKCNQKRFNQLALAFIVKHPKPHQNISTEIHMAGGPFTLVPLKYKSGENRSAVVWMEEKDKALKLLQMEKQDFQKAVNNRSCNFMGKLTVISEISSWPIISQLSKSFYAQRTALVAEAAHVFPPIGAQGLNTSIADISTLLDLAREYEIGSDELLKKYNRLRKRFIEVRMTGINTLNTFSIADTDWKKNIRKEALNLIHNIKPVRTKLMEYGLRSL